MATRKPYTDKSIDGISFESVLRGGNTLKRDALYWHYPHYSNQGGVPGGAIRSGDWKLIEFYEDGRLELFNLKDDIGEKHNLSKKESKICARLHEQLKQWRRKVNASIPRVNPNYDPVKADQHLTGVEPPTPAL